MREKRVRPGLDDKVLADWNGLMIAALANAGALFGEPAWLAHGGARLPVRCRQDDARGDRLGHSWREGRLLFPGLASDHAAMIRAALALHEATGERRYLERALAWQARARPPLRQPRTTAAISSPRTTPKAWWCARAPPPTTRRPTRTRWRRRIWFGSPRSPAQHAWREQADRLIDGVLARRARISSCHLALLNALDLRLRAAEIVVTGAGERADALAAAALKLPFLDRIVLRAPIADALPASHPAQDKIAAAERRGVRLRRRDLLAAGDPTRCDRHRCGVDA